MLIEGRMKADALTNHGMMSKGSADTTSPKLSWWIPDSILPFSTRPDSLSCCKTAEHGEVVAGRALLPRARYCHLLGPLRGYNGPPEFVSHRRRNAYMPKNRSYSSAADKGRHCKCGWLNPVFLGPSGIIGGSLSGHQIPERTRLSTLALLLTSKRDWW